MIILRQKFKAIILKNINSFNVVKNQIFFYADNEYGIFTFDTEEKAKEEFDDLIYKLRSKNDYEDNLIIEFE